MFSALQLANPLTLAIKIKLALIAFAILAAFAAGLYGVHRLIVKDAVTLARVEEDKKLNERYNKLLQDSIQTARGRETKLQEDKTRVLGERDAKIADLNRGLDIALHSLRNRPERPTAPDVRAATDAGKACTGPQLYRDDAEFLTRFAATASAVDTDRLSCYKRLEDQAGTVNGKPPE